MISSVRNYVQAMEYFLIKIYQKLMQLLLTYIYIPTDKVYY